MRTDSAHAPHAFAELDLDELDMAQGGYGYCGGGGGYSGGGYSGGGYGYSGGGYGYSGGGYGRPGYGGYDMGMGYGMGMGQPMGPSLDLGTLGQLLGALRDDDDRHPDVESKTPKVEPGTRFDQLDTPGLEEQDLGAKIQPQDRFDFGGLGGDDPKGDADALVPNLDAPTIR